MVGGAARGSANVSAGPTCSLDSLHHPPLRTTSAQGLTPHLILGLASNTVNMGESTSVPNCEEMYFNLF